MKRVIKALSFVLAIIMLFSCFTSLNVCVFAEQSGVFLYNIVGEEVIITGLDASASGNIVVPAEIGGVTVAVIDGAFKDNLMVTSVVLPDTVRSITAYSFAYCKNLENVTLSSGLNTIGEAAFYACTSLKSIEIPSGVISLGNNIFSWCSSLTDAVFSDGVSYISQEMFYGCTNLENIVVPQSIVYAAMSALSGTKYYNTESNWEDGLLYLENHILAAKTTISGRCVIKPGTKSISEMAFVNCSQINELVIYDSVKKIRKGAFSGCTGLTDVYFSGTAEDRLKIEFGKNNTLLKNALWHYGYDPNVKEYMPGDINGDDQVNYDDMQVFVKHLLEFDVDVIEDVLDINADSEVSIKDAVRFSKYLAGWDVKIYSKNTMNDLPGEDQSPVIGF